MVHAKPLPSFALVQRTPVCSVNMKWAGSKQLNMCTCADPDSTNGRGETKTTHTHRQIELHFWMLNDPTFRIELGNEYDSDATGLKDIPGDIVGRKDIPGDIGVLKDVAGDIVGDAGYAVE